MKTERSISTKMARIEDSPYPLVFKTALEQPDPQTAAATNQRLYRARVRSLEGMQKEALVTRQGGSSWRMVCDEGPYLNGTDLAPFPLAFYTAGLLFSYMSRILTYAAFFDITLKSLRIAQDNFGSPVFSGEQHNILCPSYTAGLAKSRYPSRSKTNR